MITFAKRTMKIFFRDKTAVFFSLLSVIIIIGMYALFLGDVWTQSWDFENTRAIIDNWIMSGLLAVVSVTSTMGAFGIMVEDRHKKIAKDFYSSPIKRSHLAAGYITGSFSIGLIMSIITFIAVEIYLLAKGGSLPNAETVIKILGLMVLTTITNTAMLFFIISFLKSQNAFGTASSIIGTLIGFLTGIYLPVGALPEGVQIVIKTFPISHAATLFRQFMMEPVMNSSFEGAPAETREYFSEFMGVTLTWSGKTIPVYVSIIILVVTALIFYGLSIINISRKSR